MARLLAPIDDPRLAEFVAHLNEINELAERSPGFVWRLRTDSGNATDVVYNDDLFMIVNMSVWHSVEALRDYTYTSKHVEVFRRRAEWFERPAKPHYCLWWVPMGHVPTVAEARKRLEQYQAHGRLRRRFDFRGGIRRRSWWGQGGRLRVLRVEPCGVAGAGWFSPGPVLPRVAWITGVGAPGGAGWGGSCGGRKWGQPSLSARGLPEGWDCIRWGQAKTAPISVSGLLLGGGRRAGCRRCGSTRLRAGCPRGV